MALTPQGSGSPNVAAAGLGMRRGGWTAGTPAHLAVLGAGRAGAGQQGWVSPSDAGNDTKSMRNGHFGSAGRSPRCADNESDEGVGKILAEARRVRVYYPKQSNVQQSFLLEILFWTLPNRHSGVYRDVTCKEPVRDGCICAWVNEPVGTSSQLLNLSCCLGIF